MSFAALLPIILQYGIPVAEQLWKMLTSTSAPTQADWDTLKALSAQNSTSQMLAALAAAGIDPASPQGKAFLALAA